MFFHDPDRTEPRRREPIPTDRTKRWGALAAIGALVVAGGLHLSAVAAPATTDAATQRPASATQTVAASPSAFVPIPAYRTYDSRLDPDESGRIFAQEQRFVDAAVDVDGVEHIPDEATAVSFNITVTATQGSGFVQVSAPGTDFGETSTVNWTGDDQTVANSGDVLLYEGSVENNLVFHLDGIDTPAAHVVIDVTGYYVPVS